MRVCTLFLKEFLLFSSHVLKLFKVKLSVSKEEVTGRKVPRKSEVTENYSYLSALFKI